MVLLSFFWLSCVMGWGAWVSLWDLRIRTIPNCGLLYGFLTFGLLAILRGDGWQAMAGGGMTAGIGFLLWRFTSGFGGGDMKYWMMLGVALGPWGAFWTLALAAFAVLSWGVLSGDWHKRGSHAPLPLGPWLAAASVVVAGGILLFRG